MNLKYGRNRRLLLEGAGGRLLLKIGRSNNKGMRLLRRWRSSQWQKEDWEKKKLIQPIIAIFFELKIKYIF